jgi:hypothetical protein
MLHSLRKLAVVSTVAMAFAASTAWAADEVYGTWKLNTAKSQFKPGPAPKASTIKFEASGKGVKSTQEMVPATGDKTTGTYTAQYDGKDYPVTGSPVADTVALKMTNAKTVERVDKKGGKVVQTFVRTISADGKTMKVTQKGTNAKGEAIDNVMLFDRQ